MSRQIIISRTAFLDIEQSVDYYKNQQKGLGRRFENQAHSTFKKIQQFPFAASFAFDEVRYKLIDKFPYIILYEFDEVNIYILRVFHTNQSPDKL